MIEVTPDIVLADDEIQARFVRASGPGGQHVNKTSTAVELRFDVRASPALPEGVRARLYKLAGSRLTQDGVLIVVAQSYRSQEMNRQDALDRLLGLIRKAAEPPPPPRARPGRRARRPSPPTPRNCGGWRARPSAPASRRCAGGRAATTEFALRPPQWRRFGCGTLAQSLPDAVC
jgi:ribosome-associated protein